MDIMNSAIKIGVIGSISLTLPYTSMPAKTKMLRIAVANKEAKPIECNSINNLLFIIIFYIHSKD